MGATRARAALAALLLASAVVLLVPLGRVGVVAPFELEAAGLARRIAAARLGAAELAAAGDHAPPTLGDLGMGELPFTSAALAFRALGLDVTAGRLPSALAALVAIAAITALAIRLARPQVGWIAVAVLVTCPAFALPARTLGGDGMTIAAFALAWAGLVGATVERGRAASGWMAVAVLGLAAGGLCRGVLLGVAAPLVAAGLGGVAWRGGLGAAARRPVVALGAGIVVAGLFAWRAATIVAAGEGDAVFRLTGMPLGGAPAAEASFDRVLRLVGHGAFPWSALAPFALGTLLGAPPPGVDERAGALRVHVLAALVVTVVLATAVVPWAGVLPWSGVAPLALAVALALDDVAERPPRDAAAALVTAMVAGVLAVDLLRDPDRILAALAPADARLPPGMDGAAGAWIAGAAAGVAAPIVVALLPTPPPGGLGGARDAARAAVRDLFAAWAGWLGFALVVVEAALAGLAGMVLVGRWLGWDAVLRLSQPTTRAFTHAFWVVPLACLGAPVAILGARAALHAVARRARVPVPLVAAALATAAALAHSLGFHVEVARRASPAGALEAYAARRDPGEPLGVVSLGRELAILHGVPDVRTFDDPGRAGSWLAGEAADASERRWLVVPADDLPRLNALHRGRAGRNVPVAHAAGAALLVTSDLRGAPDHNPLADVVLDAPPAPVRPVAADLDGAVRLLGWEIQDDEGRRVDAIELGRSYRARFFVRSVAPLAPSFRPFLHVERGRRRWNGDEAFVDRGYPSSLWQPGDVVVLECSLELDATFPPGEHAVWFGFFAGSARLPVLDGPARGDRVHLGALLVR